MKKTILGICLLVALLTGCAAQPAAAPTPAPTAEATPAPATPVVTEIPETTPDPGPTATPEPTPIPTPTPVPEAEPTPTPGPLTLEEADALLRENGAVCGVAYLGQSAKTLASEGPALLAAGGYNWRYPFLGDSHSIISVDYNGPEVYAIIPRSDVTASVYEYYVSKDYSFTEGMGQFLTTAAQGQPILLKCNESVTTPNTILVLNVPGSAQVGFIPRVTLGDERLMLSTDKIMDLTIYDFELK